MPALPLVLAAVLATQDPAPLASFDTAWASIARTYYDTSLVHGRWRAAHDSIRASLGSAPDAGAVRRAIRALIAVPGESHFVLIPAGAVPQPASERNTEGAAAGAPRGSAGLDLRTVEGRAVVWRVEAGGAAERAGIRPGDVVQRIGGRDLDSARRSMRRDNPTPAADTDRLLTRLAIAVLDAPVGDTVFLGVEGRGGRRTAPVVLGPIRTRMTQVGNLPPQPVAATRDSIPIGRDGTRWIAMIRFTTWFPALSAELDSLFFASRGATGIIVDLRGNPGGIIGMLAGVSGHLFDSTVSLGTLRGRGSTIRFVANPRRVDVKGGSHPPFRGPVAILTDELTGSTSEFFAAGMQATARARVFGDRSAGQSLPAVMRRLPSGDVLLHAIADHVDAAGRRIEGVGVRPDEVVRFSRRDLSAGRDPVLVAARDWIARRSP